MVGVSVLETRRCQVPLQWVGRFRLLALRFAGKVVRGAANLGIV